MVNIAIALGSNLGDRERTLREALEALGAWIHDLRASTFHDTAPVGVVDQPRFLNAAATGCTTLPPHGLLTRLLATEQHFGRQRPYLNAPRTLDLDVILYGDQMVDEPDLVIPHPRFRERCFVLEPLAEIAEKWVDPGTGRTVGELLELLRSRRSTLF